MENWMRSRDCAAALKRGAALAVLILFGLLPASAHAAQVLGVIATPNPTKTGQATSIKVNGKNLCAKMQVDFGDPALGANNVKDFTNVDFSNGKTLDLSVTYQNAGTKTVRAKGMGGGCDGNKTVALVVQTGGGGTTKPGIVQKEPLVLKPGVIKAVPMPLGVSASATPFGNKAKFQVNATRPAVLKLRLFGLPIPPAKPCNETLSPAKATFALGEKETWPTEIVGLEAGRKYFWEVCASEGGQTARAAGEFKTVNRTIEITFGKIDVTDDSDDLSPGDLWFIFEAGGQRKEHSAKVNTGNSTVANQKIVITEPGTSIKVKIRGGDSDTERFISASARDLPDDDYTDWGVVDKTVNASVVGRQSGDVETYNWTATDHGLGFKIQVQVKFIF